MAFVRPIHLPEGILVSRKSRLSFLQIILDKKLYLRVRVVDWSSCSVSVVTTTFPIHKLLRPFFCSLLLLWRLRLSVWILLQKNPIATSHYSHSNSLHLENSYFVAMACQSWKLTGISYSLGLVSVVRTTPFDPWLSSFLIGCMSRV
jgi:hypothetical protein